MLGCKMLWIHCANRADKPFSFKVENHHGRYYNRSRRAGIRGKPMDRLLATLACLVSQRSFTEECVSEVAKVPLRAAVCAIGAAVLPRTQWSG